MASANDSAVRIKNIQSVSSKFKYGQPFAATYGPFVAKPSWQGLAGSRQAFVVTRQHTGKRRLCFPALERLKGQLFQPGRITFAGLRQLDDFFGD
jgi:hypothetical protein